jgi:hypothetical protein
VTSPRRLHLTTMTVTSECATTPAEILNEALAGLRKETVS